jgi:hypothetical protein
MLKHIIIGGKIWQLRSGYVEWVEKRNPFTE